MLKSKLFRTSIAGIILALVACFILPLVPVSAGANRYFVMGQIFNTDVTAGISVTGRVVADTNFTCTGAGTFTVYRTEGITGTVAGTNVQGTPVTLAAGSNTITTTGAVADGVIDITIGTAANWNTVNNWSASSGGTGGASVPTSADDTYFDANSFTGAGQVVTVNATAYCKKMDWTGVTESPLLTFSSDIRCYGDITFASGMTTNGSSTYLRYYANASLTTNGVTVHRVRPNGATITLLDDLTTNYIYIASGTFTTNSHTINSSYIYVLGTSTFNAGTSVVNVNTLFNIEAGATITGNSTYNVAGDFTGGGLTYYNVNLTGATSTISGSNTFAELNLASGTTQTITFTDGTTQTVTTCNLDGSAGHVHTLQGSSTAGWNIVKAGSGYVSADYLSISRSTATPTPNIWYAGANSVDGLNNSGWYFTVPAVPTVATQDASSIQIFAATGNGNITDAGAGNVATDRGFDWGLISGVYIDDVTEAGSFGTGTFTNTIEVLGDNTTIFYRAKAQNPEGWGYGGELSFVTGNLTGLLTLAQNGDNQVDLTWVTDPSVAATEIRRAVGDYPATQADGVQVYLGAGTSYTDNADEVGLELDKSIYYYRAWYQNDLGNWSSTYAEGKIGGESMIFIALLILAIAPMALGFVFKQMIFAIVSIGGWLLLSAWSYTQGSAFYDALFWVSVGALLMTIIELFFIRSSNKRQDQPILEYADSDYTPERDEEQDRDREASQKRYSNFVKRSGLGMSETKRTQIKMKSRFKRIASKNERILRNQRGD